MVLELLGGCAPLLTSNAEARRTLNDHMTSTGRLADLSKHALGHLLVASPAVLEMLSTRDARHLRRADKALRSIVAEHPWADVSTHVLNMRVAEWRASFPVATACNIPSLSLTKAVMPLLAELSGLHCSSAYTREKFSELPLSVVRFMPRLTSLHVSCDVHRDAPVWSELGGLRELHLSTRATLLPPNLLSHVTSLRMLHLGLYGDFNLSHDVTLSPGLSAVPLLESLSLSGFSTPVLLSMSTDLLHLTRLNALNVSHSELPPDFLVNVASTLRVLGLTHCLGVTDATFAPPTLAYLRELKLCSIPGGGLGVTSDALVGLASLEVFRSTGYPQLVSQKALEVLGSMQRLKRLLWSQQDGGLRVLKGFNVLKRCPVTEIDLSGLARRGQTLTSANIARLPKALRSLRYSGAVTGDEPWSSLARIVVRALLTSMRPKSLPATNFTLRALPFQTLDLSGSSDTFGTGCFSSLTELRTLGLSRCRNVRRESLFTLPGGVTSISLDECKHLEIDDSLLSQVGDRGVQFKEKVPLPFPRISPAALSSGRRFRAYHICHW